MMSIDNTPDSPAKRPDGCTHRGGNYWTLFTPGIWKVFHAVSQTQAHKAGTAWNEILLLADRNSNVNLLNHRVREMRMTDGELEQAAEKVIQVSNDRGYSRQLALCPADISSSANPLALRSQVQNTVPVQPSVAVPALTASEPTPKKMTVAEGVKLWLRVSNSDKASTADFGERDRSFR
ncbi:MAG: hypothetical protein ACRERX_20030 [Pseudomonas sp.]